VHAPAPLGGKPGTASAAWRSRLRRRHNVVVALRAAMAMRMRQSLAQFERAFRDETVEDRARRERLRREAAERSYRRRQERVVRRSTARFVALVSAIVATSVLVTMGMFQALAAVFS
jgi:hypothetical protein